MTAIDLFAGLGGFTQGALQAGVRVVFAANHSPTAVEYHRRNHPEVTHACQDLQQFPFEQLPAHDILLGSPCCQGHSRGRWRDRSYDASRATAWAIVSALEVARPGLAIVENVPEIRRWELFEVWLSAIRRLGYSVAAYNYDAADCGVPQHRVRTFFVATRSRSPLTLTLPRTHHVPARAVVEWEAHPWAPVAGHCSRTLDRVTRGRRDVGREFVMPYYSGGSGLTGRSLDRPLGTLTTRARWAIVRGDQMRMLQPSEARTAMSFPAHYLLPSNKAEANHLLGNAVPPLMAETVIRSVLEAA